MNFKIIKLKLQKKLKKIASSNTKINFFSNNIKSVKKMKDLQKNASINCFLNNFKKFKISKTLLLNKAALGSKDFLFELYFIKHVYLKTFFYIKQFFYFLKDFLFDLKNIFLFFWYLQFCYFLGSNSSKNSFAPLKTFLYNVFFVEIQKKIVLSSLRFNLISIKKSLFFYFNYLNFSYKFISIYYLSKCSSLVVDFGRKNVTKPFSFCNFFFFFLSTKFLFIRKNFFLNKKKVGLTLNNFFLFKKLMFFFKTRNYLKFFRIFYQNYIKRSQTKSLVFKKFLWKIGLKQRKTFHYNNKFFKLFLPFLSKKSKIYTSNFFLLMQTLLKNNNNLLSGSRQPNFKKAAKKKEFKLQLNKVFF